MTDKEVLIAVSAYNRVESLGDEWAQATKYLTELYRALTKEQQAEYQRMIACAPREETGK